MRKRTTAPVIVIAMLVLIGAITAVAATTNSTTSNTSGTLYDDPMPIAPAASAFEPHDAALAPAAIAILEATDDAIPRTNPKELVGFLKDLYAPAFEEDRQATRTMIEHVMAHHRGLLRNTLNHVWKYYSITDLLRKYIEQK